MLSSLVVVLSTLNMLFPPYTSHNSFILYGFTSTAGHLPALDLHNSGIYLGRCCIAININYAPLVILTCGIQSNL